MTPEEALISAMVDAPNPAGSHALVRRLGVPENARVLDLGCGIGQSRAFFQKLCPSSVWRGVDIGDSDEVLSRDNPLADTDTFNGTELPYEDNSFDIVFSHQVLEHVRHPDRLMPEVRRVLAPGGVFVGEVSYLEPYHSRSVFNFTPFGCLEVMGAAGFVETRLCPSRDAFMVILRSLVGGTWRRRLRWLFRTRPTFYLISLFGVLYRDPTEKRALRKLLYSGSFSFYARG